MLDKPEDFTSYHSPTYIFGLDQKKVAAELRILADALENSSTDKDYIACQNVKCTKETYRMDYSITTYTLVFASRKPRAVKDDLGDRVAAAGEARNDLS
jgi:hypothetical protein